MSQFCPLCGTLLNFSLFNSNSSSVNSMNCPSCPYISPITNAKSLKTFMRQQSIDNDINASSSMFMDSTNVICPKCRNDRAFYYQMQTRSADEPSSIFYKCCKPSCSYQWREG